MLQHSALQVVPLDRCVLHERTDPRRVARIMEGLASEEILRNPPIVGTHPGLTNLIVVDGATRVTALRQLGVPHLIAQVVAYDNPAVELAGWNHVISDVTGAAFCAAMCAAGVAVRACPQAAAEAALAADQALAYAVDSTGSCWLLEAAESSREDPTALRHAIFASYAPLGPVSRTLGRSVPGEAAQVLVVFPTYKKAALVELVQAGYDVPPGITRHTIPERVLRINLPLSFLREEATLEQKQDRLDRWIGERWATQRMRYYQEPTIVFDE